MIQDIVCIMAGFLTAYLILRAVRSFRGGVGVLVLLGTCGQAFGTFYWDVYNDCSAGHDIYYYSRIDSNAENGPVVIHSGQFAHILFNYGPAVTCYVRIIDTGVQTASWSQAYAGAPNPKVDHYTCAPPPSYTNEVVCVGPWTNNASCCVGVWFEATNAVTHGEYTSASRQMCPGDVMPQMCATNILGTDANGNGIKADWALKRTGCLDEDYITQVIQSGTTGSSGGGGSPGTPGGGQPAPVPGDTGHQNPAPNGDTNRTDGMMLHQDLAALTRLVSKEAKQDMANGMLGQMRDALNVIKNNTNVAAGDITVTNSFNVTVTNNLAGITNLLADIKTNTSPLMDLASNLVSSVVKLATNNLASTAQEFVENAITNRMASIIDGVTNGAGAAFASGMGQFTNGMVPWGGSAGNFSGSAMRMPFAVGWFIDANLMNHGGGARDALFSVAPWIRKWLGWAITATVFWLILYRADELWRDVIKGTTNIGQGGDAAVYGVRVVSSAVVGPFVVGLLAIIPTLVIAWKNTHGIVNPMSVTGFAEDLSWMGEVKVVQVSIAFYNVLDQFIPFNVLFTGMTTWLLFFVVSLFWFLISGLVLWGINRVAPCLAFGLFLVWQTNDIQADQVRFENLCGSSVTVSNGEYVLTFPGGVTEIVLEPGDWYAGTNWFTVEPDAAEVVRASGDTNGVQVFSAGTGKTPVEWYMLGFSSGMVIFGATWIISLARSGILLRVRE